MLLGLEEIFFFKALNSNLWYIWHTCTWAKFKVHLPHLWHETINTLYDSLYKFHSKIVVHVPLLWQRFYKKKILCHNQDLNQEPSDSSLLTRALPSYRDVHPFNGSLSTNWLLLTQGGSYLQSLNQFKLSQSVFAVISFFTISLVAGSEGACETILQGKWSWVRTSARRIRKLSVSRSNVSLEGVDHRGELMETCQHSFISFAWE